MSDIEADVPESSPRTSSSLASEVAAALLALQPGAGATSFASDVVDGMIDVVDDVDYSRDSSPATDSSPSTSLQPSAGATSFASDVADGMVEAVEDVDYSLDSSSAPIFRREFPRESRRQRNLRRHLHMTGGDASSSSSSWSTSRSRAPCERRPKLRTLRTPPKNSAMLPNAVASIRSIRTGEFIPPLTQLYVRPKPPPPRLYPKQTLGPPPANLLVSKALQCPLMPPAVPPPLSPPAAKPAAKAWSKAKRHPCGVF
jgi:hypothetical protein